MKMFTCKYVRDEVIYHRLRVGSKKHALSLPEGKAAVIFMRGAYVF